MYIRIIAPRPKDNFWHITFGTTTPLCREVAERVLAWAARRAAEGGGGAGRSSSLVGQEEEVRVPAPSTPLTSGYFARTVNYNHNHIHYYHIIISYV